MRRTSTAAVLLLLGAVGPALQGQTRVDVLFNGTLLNYQDSELKQDGTVGGVYLYVGNGLAHVIEGAFSRTRIDYRDGSNLRQVDLSAAYTHYFTRSTLRAGGHMIDSTDPLTDGGTVVFGSAGLYVPYEWDVGVEVSRSSYPNYDDSDSPSPSPSPGPSPGPGPGGRSGTDGLNVLQISPGAGVVWGDFERYGSFYATVRGYYIRLSKDVDLGDRTFVSVQASLDYYYKRVTVSGYVWRGAQAFAVRQGGFTAFNLPERHTGGYGGSLRYVLGSRAAATLGAYDERFRDIGVDTDVSTRVFILSLGFTL
jgi:hypothetical protein